MATPKRRKQRRTTPEGGKLPAAVELRALKVSQKTLDAYHRHIKEFEAWATKKGYKVNARNLDMQVTRYLTHLALAQPSTGSYLVFGLQLLRCTVPRQSYLPNSKEALAGWKKLARLPAPEEFVMDFAYLAVDQGNEVSHPVREARSFAETVGTSSFESACLGWEEIPGSARQTSGNAHLLDGASWWLASGPAGAILGAPAGSAATSWLTPSGPAGPERGKRCDGGSCTESLWATGGSRRRCFSDSEASAGLGQQLGEGL